MALPCANGMRDVTSMQILVRGRERKDLVSNTQLQCFHSHSYSVQVIPAKGLVRCTPLIAGWLIRDSIITVLPNGSTLVGTATPRLTAASRDVGFEQTWLCTTAAALQLTRALLGQRTLSGCYEGALTGRSCSS